MSALSATTVPLRRSGPLGYFRSDCRLCHSARLVEFLDLGMQPHSDNFLRPESVTEPEHQFPLRVAICEQCGQVQLNYIVRPEYLYGENYLYESSITRTGRAHFEELAATVVDRFQIGQGALSVDIGSNVGLLLSYFREAGLRVLGFDPAPIPIQTAIGMGIETIPKLFAPETAAEARETRGRAAVLTATNVFAHIDDLDEFVRAVDLIVAPGGILVIEAPYLLNLVQNLEYDTIYHQHLSFISVRPLIGFFRRLGMELFDCEFTSIHGGSLRLFVARPGERRTTSRVGEFVAREEFAQLHDTATLNRFAAGVQQHRVALTRLMVELKDAGKTIVGISAPAKGNTLLNYCGINNSFLSYITEKSGLKVGRLTPGTHIPIVTDEMLYETRPDYAIILAWNFATEIMSNMRQYKELGGRFIVPIPRPQML